MLDRMFMGAAADDKLFVEDVFSTYLYTGNGSSQTITNGIDLAGKGGLVWAKKRSAADGHGLADTVRGGGKLLETQSTAAEYAYNANNIPSFTSSGFNTGINFSNSGATYASWTFREAPKFFDVVTWTGNSTYNRQIPHSLGVTPGFIIVKATSTTGNWVVYHRSSDGVYLNTTGAASSTLYPIFFGDGTNAVAPTATNFTVGGAGAVNASGQTYVAYLFAHDATSDGIIQCGSFTTDGSGNATVNLGYEPQWLMAKCASDTGNWFLFDTMRGLTADFTNPAATLFPNLTTQEVGNQYARVNATGFAVQSMAASQTYIYIAIRRGPMRTPTLGTSVFLPVANSISPNTAYTTGFPVDWILTRKRASDGTYVGSRLTGNGTYLTTNTTNAEAAYTAWYFDKNTGTMASNIYSSAQSYIYWNFRRAPGFFDEVCYTGTGVARTVNHNLGVAPEFWIIKRRSGIAGWLCGTSALGNPAGTFAQLQTDSMFNTTTFPNIFTVPTATTFGIGTSIPNDAGINNTGSTYVAYLFASCAGVSKVGSYTGNGSSQTINCAFTAGSRFVMIKRTDAAGDWYVWDTARGIVAANDPHLSLNTTAAEVTTDDTIDTDSSGFVVNQDAATNVNVSSATYIYLAIA